MANLQQHSPQQKSQVLRFWVLTLAALVTVLGTFALGLWQLNRAEQKTTLQQAIQAQKQRPALENRAWVAIKSIADEMHRPVQLSGRWAADKTIYLDNRAMNGRAGFWVVTPLLLESSSDAVLVQRGWLPRNFADRALLPEYTTATGLVTVTGRIAPPPSQIYALGEAGKGTIRQNVDLAQLRLETSLPLRVDAMVLQTQTLGNAATDGLSRDWPVPDSGVAKHYGYAFQWFALCALAAGLYAWFQWLLPWHQRRKA